MPDMFGCGSSVARTYTLTNLVLKLWKRLSALIPAAGFDARFYKASYGDIAGFNNFGAIKHYNIHGRREGRYGNLQQLIHLLEERYSSLQTPFNVREYRKIYPRLSKSMKSDVDLVTHFFLHARPNGCFTSYADVRRHAVARDSALPRGFKLKKYRQLNPDLAKTYSNKVQYIAHFLEKGWAQGRSYSAFHPTFYRNLYRPDWHIDVLMLEQDWVAHKSEPRFATWLDMLNAYDFTVGPWLERINFIEFKALNAHWAGALENKEQAVLSFVKEGWRRLAPLGLGDDFDPSYYREKHPLLADLTDENLYKSWLFVGLPLGDTPSPRKELSRLGLDLAEYPSVFPWAAYAATYANACPDKWSVLEYFLSRGFPEFGFAPQCSGCGPFLISLADRYAVNGDDRTAICAYEAAKRVSCLDPETRQHLGDAHLRLGLWTAAAGSYSPLLEAGTFTLWTVLNAATCALKSHDPLKALEILELGKSDFSGEPRWLEKVDEAIDYAFLQDSLRARGLYDEDRVSDGDLSLLWAVDRTVDRFSALAPLGAPIPASRDGAIVILANYDLRQCTHYRVEQKAELLDLLERPHQIFSAEETLAFTSALIGASAAIFYRVPAVPNIVKAILCARALGITTYYEIDDFIFDSSEYPAPIETYGGQLSRYSYNGLRFGTPLVQAAMALCDYGIASTDPLAKRMASFVRTGKCFVVRNGLDSRNELFALKQHKPKKSDDIVIFYGSGTLAHNSDFLDLAGLAILKILQRYSRIKLVLVGYLVLNANFDLFSDRIIHHDFSPDVYSYWNHLASADINLAVLTSDAMTDCKSEIKWLEAAVLGIPSIVSATAAYRAVLEDGRDVLMATTPEDWDFALTRLVEDADLRRRIGVDARTKATTHYALKAGAKSLALAFGPADELQRLKPKRKPRLLIVNVYFPPQTIGGATRVVRDNVNSWISSGFAEEFDIAIVATDHGADPAYAARVEAYRNIPVFRIAPPREVNMDWRPLNPEMGAIFNNILDTWQPDLVHFHATQQLTASCVEQCQAAAIPYVVTVHDAWWISDWQFLIDQDGRLRDPAEPLLDPTSTGITPQQSSKRKARLADVLHKAEAVLAVSSAFATIYHQAGITEAVAVPNGAPHIERLPRRPSASGRVRLGHMGGMTAHKGYPLIYAALQQGGFDNLELTIVDHGRRSGEEYQTWGTTPVRIIPRYPQAAVSKLYAEMDVLLAPSIWPESYGLVAREALACGLWVVASNLGAMGEDVVPDINGFVIDVSSPAGLKDVLSRIDADPDRFLLSPETLQPVRSTDDQAADLIAIYRRILADKSNDTHTSAAFTVPADGRISETI